MNLSQCTVLAPRPLTGIWYRAIQPQFWTTALATHQPRVIPRRFNTGNTAIPQFELLYLSENHLAPFRGTSPVGISDTARWDHPTLEAGMDGAQCGGPAPRCSGSDPGFPTAIDRDHGPRAHRGLAQLSATPTHDISQPTDEGGPDSSPGRSAVCSARPGRLLHPLGEVAVLQQPDCLPPEAVTGQLEIRAVFPEGDVRITQF